MPNTSDFILYASAATNIVTQSAYAGDTNTTNGRSSGVWPSANMNKMIRQASYASAAFGSLINTYANQNAVDNGNLSTFTASVLLAIQNIALTVARTTLKANTTFYVSTTGNDSNNGLAVGTPWATLQHAYNTIQNTYDLNGFTVTLQLANGTYNQTLILSGPLIGQGTPGNFVINGNATPTLVVVNGGLTQAIQANFGGSCVVQNMQVQGLVGLSADGPNTFVNFKNIVFGVCTTAHIYSLNQAYIQCIGNYSIAGNAPIHANVGNLAYLDLSNGSAGVTITVGGGLTFSLAFAYSQNNAVLFTPNTTFSTNVATGVRYNVIKNATIDTGGAAATYFPGNASGTFATNGIYA